MTPAENIPTVAGGSGVGPLHLVSEAEDGGVPPASSAAASLSSSSSSRRRQFAAQSPHADGASTSDDPGDSSPLSPSVPSLAAAAARSDPFDGGAGAETDADNDTAADRTRARAEALITAALYQQHVENDLDRALSLHESALGLYRSAPSETACAADGPASERRGRGEYDIEIAVTLTDIGDVRRRRKESAEAMETYREALAIFRTMFSSQSSGQKSQSKTQIEEEASSSDSDREGNLSENHPGVRAAVRGIRLLGGEVEALVSSAEEGRRR